MSDLTFLNQNVMYETRCKKLVRKFANVRPCAALWDHESWGLMQTCKNWWGKTRIRCSRNVREIEPWSSDLEKKKKSGWKEKIWMIIYKRLANPDDHLQKVGPSGWSFAKGQSIRMIICKRPAHLDGHLQKAGLLGWSFAKGRPIWIVIFKRPAHQDDCLQKAHPDGHLKKAWPSGWSFAKGRPIWMVICKRPAHLDDPFQKQQ